MFPQHSQETKIKVSMEMTYLPAKGLIYEILLMKCIVCSSRTQTQLLFSEHQTLHVGCGCILKGVHYLTQKKNHKHRLHFSWPVFREIWVSWFFKCKGLVAEIEWPSFSTVRHFNKEPRSNYWLNRCCVLISGHGCHVNATELKRTHLFHFSGWHLFRDKLISFWDLLHYRSPVEACF